MFDIDERLQKALEIAYAHLNRRDRTVAEVRGQLERRGISGGTVDAALRALTDQRLLDDLRYARLYVEDKRALEQWGAERIRRGLLSRGIDRELAEEVLGEGAGDDAAPPTELERARGLLRRRYPTPPRDRRERERALGFLLRKGYGSELALDALSAHGHED